MKAQNRVGCKIKLVSSDITQSNIYSTYIETVHSTESTQYSLLLYFVPFKTVLCTVKDVKVGLYGAVH